MWNLELKLKNLCTICVVEHAHIIILWIFQSSVGHTYRHISARRLETYSSAVSISRIVLKASRLFFTYYETKSRRCYKQTLNGRRLHVMDYERYACRFDYLKALFIYSYGLKDGVPHLTSGAASIGLHIPPDRNSLAFLLLEDAFW